MKTCRNFFVVEVDDEYWKARYDSETNETKLEYDTAVAIGIPMHSLIQNYIYFKGNDLDRVIKLLQKLKEESEL